MDRKQDGQAKQGLSPVAAMRKSKKAPAGGREKTKWKYSSRNNKKKEQQNKGILLKREIREEGASSSKKRGGKGAEKLGGGEMTSTGRKSSFRDLTSCLGDASEVESGAHT